MTTSKLGSPQMPETFKVLVLSTAHVTPQVAEAKRARDIKAVA